MKKFSLKCLAAWLGLLMALPIGLGWAQSAAPLAESAQPEISLELGPVTLPVTGIYTITFRLRGGAVGRYTPFPEIEGLKKSRKTSTTTTRSVQGHNFSEHTITQEYMPYGEGEVVIKPFQMTVNGQTLHSAGATVQVGAGPAPTQSATPSLQAEGSLDQLFGRQKPVLYQEVTDHAFLAIVADKESVFVGEGVRVGVYFYLTPADQALLAFHDFDDQLPRLLHQLHQPSAWAVAGASPSAVPDTIRQGGQLYLRFRLTESTYYPLTSQPLHFPPLALTMTKFRLLKKPEPGVDNRLAAYKTFLAPALGVAVRALPSHAGTSVVPVGEYQIQETISHSTLHTGQLFAYSFSLVGRGNLAALLPPVITARKGIEMFGPEMREETTADGGRKLFHYRLLAHNPGPLPLDSLFYMVVFNPHTVRYDTLRPTLKPVLQGPVQASTALPKPADDPFYGRALSRADSELQDLDIYQQVRRYADWLLAGLLLITLYGTYKSVRW